MARGDAMTGDACERGDAMTGDAGDAGDGAEPAMSGRCSGEGRERRRGGRREAVKFNRFGFLCDVAFV